VTERGPEEGGARWPEGGFLFTAAHAGKRFRISCTVRAYGRLSDGTEVACGEATAYAFARVKRDDELAVSLEAAPEPAGVWQTITLTAKLDLCDGENAPTPPFTYRWTFGDDPNKVVERQRDDTADTVHYFYKQLYRYLVRVEVTDSDGRRGSASMWVHVGLAVRLGSPMSMYVPLREYIREGENKGLADPSWTPEQIQPYDYLHAGARYPAQIVCVAVKGQTLPYEYTHQRTQRLIQYPRVDPIWGTMELLPVLQLAGFSIKQTGQVMVQEHGGGWSNGWGPRGVWWVPDNTYLWPLNARVRSTSAKAYWWNYWTNSACPLSQKGLSVLRVTAKLGWMESWDLAATTVVEAKSIGGDVDTNPTLSWFLERDPCTGASSYLLIGGTRDTSAYVARYDIFISHPWWSPPRVDIGDCSGANDRWQCEKALAHRALIQVGAVQSVERFDEGSFGYPNGSLHYYLQIPPPLLDTFSCPNDAISHAWYADRGGPMRVGGDYQSYRLLSECPGAEIPPVAEGQEPERGWLARIGWRDSPAFVVPPTNGPFTISSTQSQTPTLYFYTSVAMRTYFFPFSYVPVVQTGGWKINFNGTASYDPVTGAMQYMANQNAGASDQYTPSLQQPETGFGPYNSMIKWRFRR